MRVDLLFGTRGGLLAGADDENGAIKALAGGQTFPPPVPFFLYSFFPVISVRCGRVWQTNSSRIQRPLGAEALRSSGRGLADEEVVVRGPIHMIGGPDSLVSCSSLGIAREKPINTVRSVSVQHRSPSLPCCCVSFPLD